MSITTKTWHIKKDGYFKKTIQKDGSYKIFKRKRKNQKWELWDSGNRWE